MNAWRLLLLATALVALGGVVWWALDARLPLAPVWNVEAEDPVLIGTPEDPFAYTGGEHVQSTTGSVRLHLEAGANTPTLWASIHVPEQMEVLLDAETVAAGDVILRFEPDDGIEWWEDVSIHGDSGRGEPRLPETLAVLAGQGRLSVWDGPHPLAQNLPVFWSVAQAIRHSDGSIRQQGLTFTPLLRDKRGFEDPDRWEFTLLVYAPPHDGDGTPQSASAADSVHQEDTVVLQIVYRDLVEVPGDELN